MPPRALVVGTAGHIDHGKSALVRALTGIDPDRLPEERARGITIDLGFAHATIGDVNVSFVDVPGHERFVRNMLAGAGGIDAVLLVVAANESVKPQTREHLAICRLLGIDRGVIVVSKCDLVDPPALDRTRAEIAALVSGTFLATAPVVAVSAAMGTGLDDLRGALAAIAVARDTGRRPGCVRLPIDRVFSAKGFGAVVTGTLLSGTIEAGDELVLLPAALTPRVRGLQVHGKAAASATGPLRVAANLAGVEAARIRRGMTLATPGSLAVSSRADASVTWLDDLTPSHVPRDGARVRVHSGTDEVVARLQHVPATPGVIRLRFARPIVVTRGDRVVLRSLSPAATIGGAVIIDPEPPRFSVRRDGQAARLARLATVTNREAAAIFMEDAGGRGVDPAIGVRRAGLVADEARETFAALVRQGAAVTAGGRIFAAEAERDVREHVLAEIAAFHRTRPDDAGAPAELLRSRLAPRAAPELVDAAVAALAREQAIRAGDRIALATHARPAASADPVAARIERELERAALAPPDLQTLARDIGADAARVERALRALATENRVRRLGDLFFHAAALDRLKQDVAALRAGRPGAERVTLDVGAFKTRFALTRKHAIPLLEWLDREGVTRRLGEARVIVPR